MNDTLLDRLPPQNLDAEMSVLGAALVDREAATKVIEILSPDSFYTPAHQTVYKAVAELYEQGDPIDLITVSNLLRKRELLDSIGGAAYLAELVNAVHTTANVEYHAGIVEEKATLRRLIRAGNEIIALAYDGRSDVGTVLDEAEKKVFEIGNRSMGGQLYHIKPLLNEAFEKLEARYENEDAIDDGIASGLVDLDELLTGFHPSDLVVLAARPAMGKTAFVLNIATNIAVKSRKPVAIFSLEMGKEQIAQRILCGEAEINAYKLKHGQLHEHEWSKLTSAIGRLSDAPIYIDDAAGITALEIRAKCRRLKAELKDLGMIVIDYLQLMEGTGGGSGGENRQQEISKISRSLKQLARELKVPVVALSQLSRAVETRTNKRPQLSDLRECVTGDTLVYLADGRRVPIDSLVGEAPNVLAMTPEGRIVTAQSDLVWKVGRKPVFRVQLASGRAIKATAEHLLFGEKGWQRVADLTTDSRLAIARSLPEPAQIDVWPAARVALLGQLIGDGSFLSGQPMRYTTTSEDNSRLVRAAATAEFGARVTRIRGRGHWHQLLISGNGNRWHPEGVNKWLRQLGIFGQRSHEKRIPEAAFRLGNEQIALLLRHLWATDGTLVMRRSGTPNAQIMYSTTSSGLAQDIAALLLRLGIVARIRQARKGGYRPSYHVWISGVTAQRQFMATVGAFGPRLTQAGDVAAYLTCTEANTNVDTLPRVCFDRIKALMKEQGISHRKMAAIRGTVYGGAGHFSFAPSRTVVAEYAHILGDTVLENLATNELFWDTVTAVEPIGDKEVYDLTVPGPSSWLADGIVSHNSGAIEQDADIVMFIYRDEYYNPESDFKNTAEVIVGKHRNGPVGTVKLFFDKDITKFRNLSLDPGQY